MIAQYRLPFPGRQVLKGRIEVVTNPEQKARGSRETIPQLVLPEQLPNGNTADIHELVHPSFVGGWQLRFWTIFVRFANLT